MPTHTPISGLRRRRLERPRLRSPDWRSSRMQSGIAPCPGRTIRSAALTSSGLEVTTISKAAPRVSAATWRTACDTERRLPMP